MIKYFCDRAECEKEITTELKIVPKTVARGGRCNGVLIVFDNGVLCEECAKKFEQIKDQLKHEEDIFNMTDEEIELLIYAFKIGDEVITSTGEVGIIKDICTCEKCKERGFFEPTVDFGDYTDYIMTSDKNDGFKSYYKIGDRVFENINEESVNKELEEIGARYNKLVKQQSVINFLKAKKENNNGN